MFYVLIYSNIILLLFISSCINLYLLSMCLHRPFEFISWAIAIQALFSTIIFIFISLSKISLNKFLNQIPCLAHSVKLTNSASAVDRVTLFHCWDFREIGLSPSKKIKPLVDLLVFFFLSLGKIWIKISNESASFIITYWFMNCSF